MKVYLAARFSDREQMAAIGDQLKSKGVEITARWIYGGEEGLTRQEIAVLDLADVDACDTLLLFTLPRGTPVTGGGRHTEFGYALRGGKTCTVIGPREHVFCHAPNVNVYATLDEWIEAVGLAD